MKSRKTLSFLVGAALLIIGATPLAAANGIDGTDDVRLQEVRTRDAVGRLVPVSGPSTLGTTIEINGTLVKLPPDAYVKHFYASVTCGNTEPCVPEPTYVLARGDSEIAITKPSGKIVRSRGDVAAFAFVNAGQRNAGDPVVTNYLGERQDLQDNAGGLENYISWEIVQGSSVTYWADSTISSQATSAASRWNSAIGRTYFVSTTDQANANIRISLCQDSASIGSWQPLLYWNSPERDANYLSKSSICIKTIAPEPSVGWAGVIAHELGHALGLGEQYSYNSSTGQSTCAATLSVMWDIRCSGATGYPTSADVGRVNGAYTTGQLLNFASSSIGDTYTVTWNDGAWGEYYVDLRFEKEFISGWSAIANPAHLTGIGSRSVSFYTRTLSRSFSRSTYGQSAGYYRVCGKTRHYWSGSYTFGPEVCGAKLWLN